MKNTQTNSEASAIVAQLSLDEKITMMSGEDHFWHGMKRLMHEDSYHNFPFRAARCERLGLPGVAFVDGPRGIVLHGGATSFPVSMARGASWNPQLEQQIGDVIGKEMRALGANLFGGVCVNLLRHPAWGRAQETYGEDPVHVGMMGSALVRGVEHHGMSCVKHFAANSIENARFRVDVKIEDRALHEVYLPHFKACIDAGASVVMSAYNSVNGEWCGQNKVLLTDILRNQWKFDGFVLTDFIFGMRDAKTAIDAGLDLEMPFSMVWGPDLKQLVKKGKVHEKQLDQALERLAAAQLRIPNDREYPDTLVGDKEHKALAREAAVQSMVLLKNDGPILPLAKDSNVVVIGRLADQPNLGDHGSSDGRPDYVVTPLEGLKAASQGAVTHFVDLSSDEAKQAVQAANAVILIVGYTYADEGEFIAPASDLGQFAPLLPPPPALRWLFGNAVMRPFWSRVAGGILKFSAKQNSKEMDKGESAFGRGGDRVKLTLSDKDEALIKSACELNKNVIVSPMGGSAIMMEGWRDLPRAIMMMWYPGMEGGHAFADLIFGDRSPSARLPFSIPADAAHLPPFDKDARSIEYDLWHGYRMLDRDGNAPAFPFGFGLSYSRFEYSDLRCVEQTGTSLTFEVKVVNIGECESEEVVQLYAQLEIADQANEPRLLAGFAKLNLAPGEEQTTKIMVPLERLMRFDAQAGCPKLPSATCHFQLAQNASDFDGLSLDIQI